ncbi:MAG: GntR family transcriptional regulator [Bacillota bacterium]
MFNIDARSSTPIYEQIMGQIKEAIMRGLLEPGEKLPSVREMSTLLTVNPNTVSKAYQELEREKAIETIRGRGTFVVENYQPRMDEERMQGIKNSLRKAVVESYYLGIGPEELSAMLENAFKELDER